MSANYETAGVSVTMQGVVAFIHRTQPSCGAVSHGHILPQNRKA